MEFHICSAGAACSDPSTAVPGGNEAGNWVSAKSTLFSTMQKGLLWCYVTVTSGKKYLATLLGCKVAPAAVREWGSRLENLWRAGSGPK